MTQPEPNRFVMRFDEIDPTHLPLVGGKGVNLAALSQIEDVRVPAGLCVTTNAYATAVSDTPSLADRLDELSEATLKEPEAVRSIAENIRQTIETAAIVEHLASEITDELAGLDADVGLAVRSSATAEDLATASFAGQHDSYLNVVGPSAVVDHIRRCWASLFTERAVTYRLRNGIAHRDVRMAVIVQQMVEPDVSGVLFTADPSTSNRKVATIEATFGLGEALVSGQVNPDIYRVRDNKIVTQTVGIKQLAVRSSSGGGTSSEPVDPQRQTQTALTETQAITLARLGRRIETVFGTPQDIEWCLVGNDFQIVQSRPITTLFPAPTADDNDNHVYVSVGHQQMMTDAMKPLGLSMWQLTAPAPMAESAGRLFVDVTARLASPATRSGVLEVLGRSDPLIGDALKTIIERDGFLPPAPPNMPAGVFDGAQREPLEIDARIVTELIEQNRASNDALASEIRTKSGTELIDFILDDLDELRRFLFDPRSLQVIMVAMDATWWLNDHLAEWLGDGHLADTLAQSVPNNVTSEMGLALLDVADEIRPHPRVVEFLQHAGDDDDFLENLGDLDGGHAARAAIEAYLVRFGMRCIGEIDITRPRWAEQPSALLPALVGNIKNFEPGAGPRRFERGRQEAAKTERDVLDRLRSLPDGDRKADETKQMIDRVRTFIGYREYPKYGWVTRYLIYKRALLAEADRLAQAGVVHDAHDVYYLTLHEFRDVVHTHQADQALIDQRRDVHRANQLLTPPRVLTSEGEAVTGTYRREDLPADALVGLAVSAGIVDGRARVITNMADADLEPGDILVTTHTDPSWSPVFVTIAGLVTEVGGLMTHGAVVAREYGLPAVVGVEDATRRIEDGQRIRVNGTDGHVELLPDE